MSARAKKRGYENSTPTTCALPTHKRTESPDRCRAVSPLRLAHYRHKSQLLASLPACHAGEQSRESFAETYVRASSQCRRSPLAQKRAGNNQGTAPRGRLRVSRDRVFVVRRALSLRSFVCAHVFLPLFALLFCIDSVSHCGSETPVEVRHKVCDAVAQVAKNLSRKWALELPLSMLLGILGSQRRGSSTKSKSLTALQSSSPIRRWASRACTFGPRCWDACGPACRRTRPSTARARCASSAPSLACLAPSLPAT
jgi:hypothetical protein